ncbi:MAG: hypothetical protein NVS2B16_37460 [Chloroflexota bacterium]
MHTSFRIVNQEPWFVIHDVDAAYHDAARQLGYGDVDGGFGSAAPAENPHVERAYDNFQRYAEPMVLQAAGVQPVPWAQTLHALLEILENEDVDWWLLGSTALVVRGLTANPRDVDLVVSDTSMFRLEELLLDYIVQPVVATPEWVHNSFARAFLHSRVEWVGGVSPTADADYPSDQGPIAARRLEGVVWHGREVRVPPLDLQLEVSRRRRLVNRAELIQRALA